MARNIDYFSRLTDFDDLQPCFYEDSVSEWEEKFYGTPAPSDDIWKKFELLPTPPRSPRRDEEESGECHCEATFCSKPSHKLSLVSGIMDDISQTLFLPISDILIPSGNLKSNLIQDCMWSGLQGEDTTKTENVKTSTVEDTATAKCVDPATVFPYPVSDSTNRDHSYSASVSCRVTPAETPSDSEDEIDVVTVDKMQFPRKQHLISATPLKASDLREQLTVLARKRPGQTLSVTSSPQTKKIRYNVQECDLKSVPLTKLSRSVTSSRSSSRASSDSEECDVGKRSQHNVLERKRRNDLKFSFLRLRDHVPELENQERAAKVVILKKATDYITQLNCSHQRHVEELNAEQERKERLLERLAELKSFEDSDFF